MRRHYVFIAPLLFVAGACDTPKVAAPSASGEAALSHGAAPVANFIAVLEGGEEVPARDTRARGLAYFQRFHDGDVAYRLIVANIENVVAAHIHCAPRGVNGPIVVGLFGAPAGGGRTQGVIADGSFDPSGLTCAGMPLIDAMGAGATYVNVHTNDGVGDVNSGPGDFPGGEIRGQVRAAGLGAR